MTNGDVVFSISDYAREFIREYKNPNLDQNVIDAIVVDFVNFFAGKNCGMDLAMYTIDLREGQKMSEKGTVLQKEVILPMLNFRKEEYNKDGINESVNRNKHMNQCGGKAKFENSEAVKLLEEFIKGYMTV